MMTMTKLPSAMAVCTVFLLMGMVLELRRMYLELDATRTTLQQTAASAALLQSDMTNATAAIAECRRTVDHLMTGQNGSFPAFAGLNSMHNGTAPVASMVGLISAPSATPPTPSILTHFFTLICGVTVGLLFRFHSGKASVESSQFTAGLAQFAVGLTGKSLTGNPAGAKDGADSLPASSSTTEFVRLDSVNVHKPDPLMMNTLAKGPPTGPSAAETHISAVAAEHPAVSAASERLPSDAVSSTSDTRQQPSFQRFRATGVGSDTADGWDMAS